VNLYFIEKCSSQSEELFEAPICELALWSFSLKNDEIKNSFLFKLFDIYDHSSNWNQICWRFEENEFEKY
jgi:hypothetical protein